MSVFPFDVISHASLPGQVGALIKSLRNLCMTPPYPWGQWLYGKVFSQHCAALPGDIIELGTGRGGTSIFFGHLARNARKTVLSLDSYRGLPEPDPLHDNPYFREGDYKSGGDLPGTVLQRFKDAIAQFQLQDVVVPVPGFFDETLPKLDANRKFCLAHIDADLFSSVLCALEHIHDRVVEGGVIIIDDFFHHAQGPLRAASQFFNSRKLNPTYHVSFPYSVFVFKGKPADARKLRCLDGNAYSLEWLKKDGYFIQVVEDSLKASQADPRAHENCGMFLELLRGKERKSSEIYTYWRALEAYWDSIIDSPAAKTGREAFGM